MNFEWIKKRIGTQPTSLIVDEFLKAKTAEVIGKPVTVWIGPKITTRLEIQMPLAVMLLGFAGQFLDQILSHGTKSNWPKDLIDAVVAAANAIGTAHTLAVTKAGLEVNRQ